MQRQKKETWLRVEGLSLGQMSHIFAAKAGHLHVLQWMWTLELLSRTMAHHVGLLTAEKDYLHILKWLQEQVFRPL